MEAAMKINRRLRGLLGTSLAWAGVFGVLSLAFTGLALLRLPAGTPAPWRMFRGTLLVWSAFGFCSGVIFSGLLIALERGRTLGSVSSRRFSAWGIVAGVLVPLYPCALLLGRAMMPGGWLTASLVCGIGGMIGLTIAQASLRVARRASDRSLTRGSVLDVT